MTRRIIALNFCLAALAIVLAVALSRELAAFSRPLPGPSPPQPASEAGTTGVGTALVQARKDSRPDGDVSTYAVIASQNLFDPSRSVAASAAAGPPSGPPLLHGVVAGEGIRNRAYVEDPTTKLVRGYQIGDMVAGWRVDEIRHDRVVIVGPERERLEVLLRDPAKPRPVAVASLADGVTTASVQAIGVLPPPAPRVSAAEGAGGAVPHILGAIPSQLFRPARARPAASEAVTEGGG